MTGRSLAKSFIEGALAASGIPVVTRHLQRDRVAIFAYHNVVPDDEAHRGDASLHLPLSLFRRHLDALQRTHTFVDLPTAVAGGTGDRIRATVTFDDAYRGAVQLALPELRRRGIPATVFVCPGLLGAKGLWWDELAEAGLLNAPSRARAMFDMRGDLRTVRQNTFAGDPPRLPEVFGVASEAELLEQAGGDIALGGHAWSHACLPALDAVELIDDLERTLKWLDAAPSRSVRWLALPYGEGTPVVARTALELGYEGVLEIRGGLCSPSDDRLAVPRINVPAGLSGRGLSLRASGAWR